MHLLPAHKLSQKLIFITKMPAQKYLGTVASRNDVIREDDIRSRSLSLHRPNHFIEMFAKVSSDVDSIDPAMILTNPHYNKGTAFTAAERKFLNLEGLIPGKVETIETQVHRCYYQLKRFSLPMSQHIYLRALRERNETLFYRLLVTHLKELMPIIYTPTVGQACQEYGWQFRQAEGMYFSNDDKGNIRKLLKNWKPNSSGNVSIIVVTDGSRILGLGDLGASGMGIPVGKLALYVAAGGFHPASTLPVLIDAGTNNKTLLDDEFYLGKRHGRLADKEFYGLMDEFMEAVKQAWPYALVQFEDFSNNHCFELLDKYRNQQLCFNDDIQGTGAVVAAGFLNAVKITKIEPRECRVVFLGAGAAGVGVADQIGRALQQRHGLTPDEAKNVFYMIDSKGLITKSRQENLTPQKLRYARSDVDGEVKSLIEVLSLVKPTALIGLSGQPNVFTREVLELMGALNEKPVVFSLSNPTIKAECTFQDAYEATDGRVIFASGSPFPSVQRADGSEAVPSQGNNLYTFPGIGYGSWLAKASRVTDGMITEATVALADCVTDDMLNQGCLYPPLDTVRETSAIIAARVMQRAEIEGVARYISAPKDHLEFVRRNQYNADYLEWI